MRILLVAAARPNVPKVWAVQRGLRHHPAEVLVVHAGQHYDPALKDVLFADLDMAPPDVQLTSGSGTPGEQTAAVIRAFEAVVADLAPDAVVVVGDVNATLSCALVAARSPALLVHVEAGLRSGDRAMPEELNRIATDHLADLLLAPSADAVDALVAEGLAARTHLVGNTMVDALDHVLPQVRGRAVVPDLHDRPYVLATLHRPSNVDDPLALAGLLDQLDQVAAELPVVLPAHPRARAALETGRRRIRVVDPLGYADFLALLDGAAAVVTDSGGVQEESTVLGVPCLTVRTTTERPVTVEHGTNRLVDPSSPQLARLTLAAAREARRPSRPEGWEGEAGRRSAEAIVAALRERASTQAVASTVEGDGGPAA